jgi:hypothetical protein
LTHQSFNRAADHRRDTFTAHLLPDLVCAIDLPIRALSYSCSPLVTSRAPESTSAFLTHSSKVCGTQPTWVQWIQGNPHRDGLFPRCSYTMRTAHSRISGGKRFDFLLMAPSSQSLEPPRYPGVIQLIRDAFLRTKQNKQR